MLANFFTLSPPESPVSFSGSDTDSSSRSQTPSPVNSVIFDDLYDPLSERKESTQTQIKSLEKIFEALCMEKSGQVIVSPLFSPFAAKREKIKRVQYELVKKEVSQSKLRDVIQENPYLKYLTIQAEIFDESHLQLLYSLEHLNKLCLEFSGLTVKGLGYLGSLDSLKKLSIKGARELKDAKVAFQKLGSIEELELDGCQNLSSADFLDILSYLKNLKVIKLRNLRVPNDFFEHLGYLKKLKEFTLDSCSGFTSLYLNFFLIVHTGLSRLEVRNCDELNNDCIEHLSKKQGFKAITIDACSNVTDNTLLSILECINLVSLRVKNCKRVTEKPFLKLVNLPKIQLIDTTGIQSISYAGPYYLKGAMSIR